MKNALRQMLDALDEISDQHEELGDTDVRERMAVAIHKSFLLPQAGYTLPAKFGMFSKDGNAKVREALRRFLNHPEVVTAAKLLRTPEARLVAFQDVSVTSAKGTHYDEYFGHVAEIIETAKALTSPLMMNLAVLKRSRRAPQAGDIFVMLPPDGFYLYGRVISTTADGGFSVPCNLIYVYRTRSGHKAPTPELRLEHLLVPPMITDNLPWSKGYFESLEHRELASKDLLQQHCFMDTYGRYFDERHKLLPGPIEPVGVSGISTLSGIDKKISKALGIPPPGEPK